MNVNNIKTSLKKKISGLGVDDIAPIAIAVGVGVIVLAIVVLILGNLQTSSSVTVNSATYNALGNGVTSLGNISAQLPLLGTIVGLMLVLGVVLFFFYNKRETGGL